MISEKICSGCGESKQLKEFHLQTRGIGGRNARCKGCISDDKKKYYRRKINKNTTDPTTVLVVGDTHITNNQDLSRFVLLNKVILDKQPETVILMGDFLTLACLSAWDANKRAKMEGKRYYKEIDAANKALDMMLDGVTYNPKVVYIEGNHEDRLTRYLEKEPTFEGAVSVPKDLRLEERGIKFVPYREYHYINEVGFTHIPFNKVREIGGINITRKASQVLVSSVVFAHTHNQELGHIHKQGMPHLQDIYCCGAFFEEIEEYMHGRVTEYWRGLTLLTMWKPSRFDIESFSLGRLDRLYTRGAK